ncbi:MAG: galactose mutarotase [Kiritimatiellae bacterium]|nr:galactose mutarotase [Kiritimatiellia bacterium]
MKKILFAGCALMAAVVLADTPKGEPVAPERGKRQPQTLRHKRPQRMAHGMKERMRSRGFVRPVNFGKLSDGREAKIWRIQGRGGLILDVSDYGGRLVRCYAPDRYGNLADVTLGWNTPAEYEKYGFSMGTLIGRYGNRIADGRFTLEGKEYQLAVNEKKDKRHCNLHGGPVGWDKKIWDARRLREGPVQGLELKLVSPDGDMGFPGTVTMKVVYRVYPDNVWSIDYEATTDKTTVLNVTHHSYWNLAGEASGDVLGQELKIFADQYTKTSEGLIPTEVAPVKGTGFDFTELRKIGAMSDWMAKAAELKPMNNWYDHNFVIRGKAGELRPAAVMRDPVSGRKLEVWTTEPCMQMYGAQNMTDAVPSKTAGRNLCKCAGIALETQHFPDSPNRPDFPSTVLKPGETFKSRTEYRFSAE